MSDINDFVVIIDTIVYFLTYPIHIFSCTFTFENVVYFTESVCLAFSAIRKLYS